MPYPFLALAALASLASTVPMPPGGFGPRRHIRVGRTFDDIAKANRLARRRAANRRARLARRRNR